MKILIIINDAPYGNEKAYNAFRMAMSLQKNHENVEVKIFLLADSVYCALPNQQTPKGYYNLETMIKSVLAKGGEIKLCGGCSQARAIEKLNLINGVKLSNMNEFSDWVFEADKVLTF
jgi:uncharacterized protein involved in oxidation of intracellular sulfur